LFEADLAVVAVPAGEHIEFIVCHGHGAEGLEGSTVPNDESLSGAVMREHEPVLLVDAGSDERLHRPAAWPEDIGPAFFVPLMAGATPLGNLVVARKSGQALFPVDQVLAMKTFAAQVALALADARAQEALRSLRVLEDRDRVAAAMSDTVVNRLSGASLTLHALLRGDLPEAAKKRIWDVIDELDGAIAAVRTAVFPR
jgi:GAF domain-containing protein